MCAVCTICSALLCIVKYVLFVVRPSDVKPCLSKFRAASICHVYFEVSFSASLQHQTKGQCQRDCVLLSFHGDRAFCWCCSFVRC